MSETFENLQELMQEQPDAAQHAEVVGAWIWIEFTAKPTADVRQWLKDHGYHWNQKRKIWQHPCGVKRKNSPASTQELRDKHGSTPIARFDEERRSAQV